MAVYFFVYILICFTAFFRFGKNREISRKNKCIFLFVILFLLFSFRHPSMGIDLGYGVSTGYLARYEGIAEFTLKEAFYKPMVNYEQGYVLFNKLLSLISKDPQFLLVGCAAVSLFPILYVTYRKSYNSTLSVIVYMGLSSFPLLFSGLRQSIAIGICFYSLLYIMEKKKMKFIIIVLLASTFHISAILFLAAYPIYYIRMDRKVRVASMSIPVSFYIFRYPLFSALSRLLKENAVPDNNNAITLFLIFLLVYLFCIIFSDEQQEISGIKNLFLIACCIQAMGGVYSTVMRVGYYYINTAILLIPNVMGRMHNRKNAVILSLGVGLCFLLFGLYSLRNGSWSQSYPYYWFWESGVVHEI